MRQATSDHHCDHGCIIFCGTDCDGVRALCPLCLAASTRVRCATSCTRHFVGPTARGPIARVTVYHRCHVVGRLEISLSLSHVYLSPPISLCFFSFAVKDILKTERKYTKDKHKQADAKTKTHRQIKNKERQRRKPSFGVGAAVQG